MEPNKVIFTTKLSGYRPVIWLGEAVVRRENQIRSILKERLGEEYAELFSNVVMHGETAPDAASASWLSSYLQNSIKLTQLKESEQQAVRHKLGQMMGRISQLCEELKNSGNKEYVSLSEVIQLATVLPSESCILTDGNKIVLVLWGFINDAANHSSVELMKFLSYDFDDLKLKIPIVKKDPVSEPPKEKIPEIVPEKTATTPVVGSIPPPSSLPLPAKKKRRFKWWWILIILGGLLFLWLLLWLLLKGCERLPLLPNNPGVMLPIDTNQIIRNPGDTLQRPVLGNRLNVILDKNADLDAFSKDFQDRFGSDAKIVYYDTLIMQLQVEFYTDDIPAWKKKIKEMKGVRIVFEESIFHSNYSPKDPAFDEPDWDYQFTAIRAFEGWDQSRGNNKVKIAILDDGFDLNHPELLGRAVSPWNVSERAPRVHTNNGHSSHGTHVAALVAGNIDNQAGASGVAPDCMIIPIQISDANGNMSTTYIINGFLYAIMQGADVINMSLGMRWPDFVKMLSLSEQQELARTMYPEEAQFWDEMYAYAEDYDVVVVQAAGNDDVLSAIDPMKRSVKTIVVGASDAQNQKSDFSNYGSRTDVSAPGTAVFSALPGNKYGLMDGTSMSSPIVAGAAGLLLSVNENLSSAEVKNILIKTGISIQTSTDKSMGPLIQLDKALALAKTTSPAKDCKQTVDSLLKVIEGLQKQLKANGSK